MISKVQEASITQWFIQTTAVVGLKAAHQQAARRYLSLWCLNGHPKHLPPVLAFSMLEQEITVRIGQRLMETALTDPVGDMLPIQVGLLPFMQNGVSLIS